MTLCVCTCVQKNLWKEIKWKAKEEVLGSHDCGVEVEVTWIRNGERSAGVFDAEKITVKIIDNKI